MEIIKNIKKQLIIHNKLSKTILNSKNKIIGYYSDEIIKNNRNFDNIFLDAGGYKVVGKNITIIPIQTLNINKKVY